MPAEAEVTSPTNLYRITVLQMAACRQVPQPIRMRRSRKGQGRGRRTQWRTASPTTSWASQTLSYGKTRTTVSNAHSVFVCVVVVSCGCLLMILWPLLSFFSERLEQDVKRLKADLQANRQLESELRSQLSSLSSQDRSLRSELGQLRQDNELLQNKWVHVQYTHRAYSPTLTTIVLVQ